MGLETAAIIGLGGLALSAGTTGASFIQAGKQNRLRRQAEAQAEKAMAEAKKRLEVNVYEQIGIQKEPYKIASEALLSQGALGVEALREGETRGAAGGVGRIQMAQTEAQQGIREAMGKELMGLDMATAEEEGRLLDIGTQLSLEEVAGAQQAAAQAEDARRMAQQQGVEGLGNLITQAAALAPLYDKGAAGRQLNRLERTAARQGLTGADFQKNIASLGDFGNVDFSGVASMTPDQFSAFMGDLKPSMLRSIRKGLRPTPNPSLTAPQQGMIGPSETGLYTGPSSMLSPSQIPSRRMYPSSPYPSLGSINWFDYLNPR